jgi:hypothetical protein
VLVLSRTCVKGSDAKAPLEDASGVLVRDEHKDMAASCLGLDDPVG